MAAIRGKRIPGKGDSHSTGPNREMYLVYSRNTKELEYVEKQAAGKKIRGRNLSSLMPEGQRAYKEIKPCWV